MKKTAIFSPFATWNFHFGTDLEIATNLLEDGNEVHVILCRSEFKTCEQNVSHSRLECISCESLSKNGWDLVDTKAIQRHNLKFGSELRGLSLPKFSSIDQLESYEWKQVPVGKSVKSSLISITRDVEFDVVKHQDLIHRSIVTHLGTYFSMQSLLKTIDVEVMYLFNGRYSVFDAAAKAAQSLKIPVIFHERAPLLNRYLLCPDFPTQHLESQQEDLKKAALRMPSDPEGTKLAAEWFESVRRGRNALSFVKEQVPSHLPSDFDRNKTNIAIFNSSDDEVATFPEWKNLIYKDQLEGLKEIFADIQDPKIHFYLRIHPHLKYLRNNRLQELLNLQNSQVTVIPPDSKVDTYQLIDACDTVLTFGSTVGIEAAYWEKPSILLGRAFYEPLPACYFPKTHQEAVELLKRKLTPKGRQAALAYGYWCSTRGIEFKYFIPSEDFLGTYRGQQILPSIPLRLLFKGLASLRKTA